MIAGINKAWAVSSASPLLWVTATLVSYRIAYAVYRKMCFHPIAHPVASTVVLLVGLLTITGTPYQAYFDGAQMIHFMLGPATVALAIPLYQQMQEVQRNWMPLLAGATLGGASAIATGMGIAWALGASRETVLSMATKSVTMPIAMGITEKIGGLPSLTAALVMLTGVFGAITAQSILKRMKITEESTCGFALGVAAHGIGASRAFQVSPHMGAFAGLAMGVSGILTALILPFALKLFACL